MVQDEDLYCRHPTSHSLLPCKKQKDPGQVSGEPEETMRSFVLLKDTWELRKSSLPEIDTFYI